MLSTSALVNPNAQPQHLFDNVNKNAVLNMDLYNVLWYLSRVLDVTDLLFYR